MIIYIIYMNIYIYNFILYIYIYSIYIYELYVYISVISWYVHSGVLKPTHNWPHEIRSSAIFRGGSKSYHDAAIDSILGCNREMLYIYPLVN